MDDLIQQMQAEIRDWAVQQAQKQAAQCLGVNGVLLVGAVLLAAKKKRLEPRP